MISLSTFIWNYPNYRIWLNRTPSPQNFFKNFKKISEYNTPLKNILFLEIIYLFFFFYFDIATEQINIYYNNSKKIGIYLTNKENEIFTSLFLKYISKKDIFELFLLVSLNNEQDYHFPRNVNKIVIDKNNTKENLKNEIVRNKIDLLI